LLPFVHRPADNITIDVKENYAMPPFPEVCFFKHDPEIRGIRRRRDWLAILALVMGLLAGVAIRESWDHGIIASAALAVKLVAVGIWNMLCDLTAACGDLLQAVLRQRSR
jgi:hypothetical protein